MSIKSKFRVSIGFAVASALAMAGIILWAYLELLQIRSQEAFGNEIRAHSVKLNLLTFELLLHRSDRVEQQWISAHRSFQEFLEARPHLEPLVAQVVNEAIRRVDAVGGLYENLLGDASSLRGADPIKDEAAQLRYARILAEVAAIISLTERTDEFLNEGRAIIARSIVIYICAGVLMVFATSAVVLFYVVPGLVHPILELRTTIQRIGAGQLERQVLPSSKDEIGDVFREVERTRVNLLVSRQRLEQANRDLSEAKEHLEDRVQARTAELDAANQDLEAFAFSVSHDLRAPLRSMTGFSQALVEDYGEELDDTGKDYASRISAACNRMGNLIDDILTLSRVARAEIKRTEVDLSEIAECIAKQLREAEPKRAVQFKIQPNVTVQGDETLLRTALENLLGNAWKYSSKKPQAIIEFGMTANGSEPAIFVRDNGAGFDMAYADKLFKPFQRLHGSDEFEGTGIGLASTANIVRRHGGRIWADAKPDVGATMQFTLSS